MSNPITREEIRASLDRINKLIAELKVLHDKTKG